jgi:methylglutaconyl-CoA hydratase
MSNDLVRYETRSPAVLLTLNRPDRRNALSRGLIAALTEAFTRARDDATARCVILTGAGNAFCAGMDLAELQEALASGVASVPRAPGKGGESPVWDDAQRLAALYDLIYTLPKPTIAAVNGTAVAGGAGLVSVCDLAVATPEARFGYPEVRRGLVAAMVMPHLLRQVGERTARHLLLTGELIDAEEARQTGFINAVVPAEQLLPRALAWGHSVAEGGPNALARTKELLHGYSRQAVSLQETARASAAPRLTDECRQGLEAFFNKRPTPWSPGY